MKYEGAVARYHSVSELAHAVDGMSREGYRIINVLDRSSSHQDTFLVIAQREVEETPAIEVREDEDADRGR